jgi:hypothetical protein
MLAIDKHAAQLKAIGFPEAPETLLPFLTDTEQDEIEKTITAFGVVDRLSEVERLGEIVRVAYRRMEMRHPGIE